MGGSTGTSEGSQVSLGGLVKYQQAPEEGQRAWGHSGHHGVKGGHAAGAGSVGSGEGQGGQGEGSWGQNLVPDQGIWADRKDTRKTNRNGTKDVIEA